MPSLFRKMDTRRLRNSDIKKIVRFLRDSPDTSSQTDRECHGKRIKGAIEKLPRRLRSPPLASHGALCGTHKGLDAHLIDDIWVWIKYELEVAIGRFLYPIIVSKVLSESEERRARQLEPVVRMFNPDWTLAESPPPGIRPIDAGDKWVYQDNGCPACLLARLGSDEDALFALFAGMYGHLHLRSNGQRGVEKIKSKRLRFVRYWMRTYPDGGQKTFDAYDLGVKLKALRKEAKASLQRSGQPTRYTRDSLDGPPVTTRHCLDENPGAVMDISDPYDPEDWTAKASNEPNITPASPPPRPRTRHCPLPPASQPPRLPRPRVLSLVPHTRDVDCFVQCCGALVAWDAL
ncbi:hypothetical protein EJ07DRAFT_172381 [Lizonia empirigonia]|nr:hypothetical protein EJ07DRAFT_172381 [Lizonia empirigonia]